MYEKGMSSEQVDAKDKVLTIWMTPCFPPARVRLSSPSGCPSFPRAVAVISVQSKSGRVSVRQADQDGGGAEEQTDGHRSLLAEDRGAEVDVGLTVKMRSSERCRQQDGSGRRAEHARRLEARAAGRRHASMRESFLAS